MGTGTGRLVGECGVVMEWWVEGGGFGVGSLLWWVMASWVM